MSRGRQTVAKWLRDMLPRKCMNCGSTRDLHYHHIVPVECNGNEVPTNIAVLCGKCHDAVHYTKTGKIDHSALVKAGIQRAKAAGRNGGKRPADYEKVMRLIAENSTQFNPESMTTETEIMEMAGVKSVCYYKCKRLLLDAMSADKWPYTWKKPRAVRGHPEYEGVILRMRGEKP